MFELDERLQNDTWLLGELPLSRVLLMNDSRYPWLILVPRQSDICEVFQLTQQQQQQLWVETNTVAQVLQQLVQADKMNIATLGNVVSQLHMHVVARNRNDAVWPDPVWGKGEAVPYTEQLAGQFRNRLKDMLDSDFVVAGDVLR